MPVDVSRNSGFITPGTHLFKITRAEEKLNQSGKLQWIIEYTCQTPGEDQGRKHTDFFDVEPSAAARWKFDLFLDAMEAPKKGTINVDFVANKTLRITIAHTEYQGNLRMNSQAYHTKSSTASPEPKNSISDAKASIAEAGGSTKKSPF